MNHREGKEAPEISRVMNIFSFRFGVLVLQVQPVKGHQIVHFRCKFHNRKLTLIKIFIIEKIKQRKRGHYDKKLYSSFTLTSSTGRQFNLPDVTGFQVEHCRVLGSYCRLWEPRQPCGTQWRTPVHRGSVNHYGTWLSADSGEITRSCSRAAAR